MDQSKREFIDLVPTNGKWKPQDVEYVANSSNGYFCKDCAYYSNEACSLVEGPINPKGYCSLYDPKEEKVEEPAETLSTVKDLSEPTTITPRSSTSFLPIETYHLSQSVLKVPLAKIGRWYHDRYGVVEFNHEDFDSIVSNAKSGILGHKPYITFGHLDEEPDSTDSHRKRGDLVDIEVSNDVLFGLFESKPEAIEAVRSGEFEYSSGEFIKNFTDKSNGTKKGKTFLRVALTNSPFIPFSESERVEVLSQAYPDFNSSESSVEAFTMNIIKGDEIEEQIHQEEKSMTDIKETATNETPTTETPVEQLSSSTSVVNIQELIEAITSKVTDTYKATIEDPYKEKLDAALLVVADLQSKLDKITGELSQQQTITQAYSTSLSKAEQERLNKDLSAKGVSPVLVERFSILRSSIEDRTVKLSTNGVESETSLLAELSQLLIDAVASEPVVLSQFGDLPKTKSNPLTSELERIIQANREKINTK